jgi:hypothetical protein
MMRFRRILIACIKQIAVLLLLLSISAGLNVQSDLFTSQKADNSTDNSSAENPSLWPIFDILKSQENVDLTHSFRPGIPHWEGFPNETVETVFNFSTSGFLTQKFILVGQWAPMSTLQRISIKGNAQLIR